jgi:hypothetical protein
MWIAYAARRRTDAATKVMRAAATKHEIMMLAGSVRPVDPV